MSADQQNNPPSVQPTMKPKTPLKKPVSSGKMLGETRDYLTVLMEQDASWSRYPSSY